MIAKLSASAPHDTGVNEGLWVELQSADGTRPTLCFYTSNATYTPKDDGQQVVIGFYRDAKAAKPCDVALSFSKSGGPQLQVAKGDDVRIVDLFELIDKLSA